MEDDSIEIDTAGVQHLVGRTIVEVERDAKSADPWPFNDESLTITLDDGSIWTFEGWGYDASGLSITASNLPSKTPAPLDAPPSPQT